MIRIVQQIIDNSGLSRHTIKEDITNVSTIVSHNTTFPFRDKKCNTSVIIKKNKLTVGWYKLNIVAILYMFEKKK